MRKAKVLKGKESGKWLVTQPNGLGFLDVDTHAEAISLAQMLADPARYIRQAEQRAWTAGHKVGVLQEYFRVPGVPNTPNGETNE